MSLSDIERQVLGALASGQTSDECARSLCIGVHEVRRHLAAAIQALAAQSKLEAILLAARRGLIDLPRNRVAGC
ncbi:MAG: hypothetical protein IT305_23640 [Chloroflexi bacterium]|nr:hypothetical protein [Chloroflexota bacterium]